MKPDTRWSAAARRRRSPLMRHEQKSSNFGPALCVLVSLSSLMAVWLLYDHDANPEEDVSLGLDRSAVHMVMFTDRMEQAAAVMASVCTNVRRKPPPLVFHLVGQRLRGTRKEVMDFVGGRCSVEGLKTGVLIYALPQWEKLLGQMGFDPVWNWPWRMPASADESLDGFLVRVAEWDHSPKHITPFNLIRFYMPYLPAFHAIDRMIFLDDDIIVQGDIVDAWEYPLRPGNFMGAGCLNWVWSECQREVLADNLTYAEVPYFGFGALGPARSVQNATCREAKDRECMDEKLMSTLREVSKGIDDQPLTWEQMWNFTTWNYGFNVMDLKEWRKQRITEKWVSWMKAMKDRSIFPATSLASGLGIALLAKRFGVECFNENKLSVLHGLGGFVPADDLFEAGITNDRLRKAFALHYNGDVKPWDPTRWPKQAKVRPQNFYLPYASMQVREAFEHHDAEMDTPKQRSAAVLITEPRSGSEWFMEELDAHPSLCMSGELGNAGYGWPREALMPEHLFARINGTTSCVPKAACWWGWLSQRVSIAIEGAFEGEQPMNYSRCLGHVHKALRSEHIPETSEEALCGLVRNAAQLEKSTRAKAGKKAKVEEELRGQSLMPRVFETYMSYLLKDQLLGKRSERRLIPCQCPPATRIVGFKMMAGWINNEVAYPHSHHDLHAVLLQQHSAKIILLERMRLTLSLLSEYRVRMLGDSNAEQYHCRDRECLARLESVVGWRVNANMFVHDMNHRIRLRLQTRARLALYGKELKEGSSVHLVTYEECTRNPVDCMRGTQRFLGVQEKMREHRRAQILRTNKTRWDQVIDNWPEMEETLEICGWKGQIQKIFTRQDYEQMLRDHSDCRSAKGRVLIDYLRPLRLAERRTHYPTFASVDGARLRHFVAQKGLSAAFDFVTVVGIPTEKKAQFEPQTHYTISQSIHRSLKVLRRQRPNLRVLNWHAPTGSNLFETDSCLNLPQLEGRAHDAFAWFMAGSLQHVLPALDKGCGDPIQLTGDAGAEEVNMSAPGMVEITVALPMSHFGLDGMITPGSTTLVASTSARDRSHCVGEELRVVTFMRIGAEWMQIMRVEVSQALGQGQGLLAVTAKRGLWGTPCAAHAAGDPVLSPVYLSPFFPTGTHTSCNRPVQYAFERTSPTAAKCIAEHLVWDSKQGFSGAWLDGFGANMYGVCTPAGQLLRSIDFSRPVSADGQAVFANSTYSFPTFQRAQLELAAAARALVTHGGAVTAPAASFVVGSGLTHGTYFDKERVHRGRDGFRSGSGSVGPFANDASARVFFNPADSAGQFERTPSVDGFNMDSFFGTTRVPQGCGDPGTCGEALFPKRQLWRVNVRALADAARRRLHVLASVGSAGLSQESTQRLSPTERHRWEVSAYASFLLAAEHPSNGTVKLLVHPFVRVAEYRMAWIHPVYYIDIGHPAQTKPDIDDYLIEIGVDPCTAIGHGGCNDTKTEKKPEPDRRVAKQRQTYLRRFTGGIVLYNPSDVVDKNVFLGGPYIDPWTRRRVWRLDVAPQTGHVLVATTAAKVRDKCGEQAFSWRNASIAHGKGCAGAPSWQITGATFAAAAWHCETLPGCTGIARRRNAGGLSATPGKMELVKEEASRLLRAAEALEWLSDTLAKPHALRVARAVSADGVRRLGSAVSGGLETRDGSVLLEVLRLLTTVDTPGTQRNGSVVHGVLQRTSSEESTLLLNSVLTAGLLLPRALAILPLRPPFPNAAECSQRIAVLIHDIAAYYPAWQGPAPVADPDTILKYGGGESCPRGLRGSVEVWRQQERQAWSLPEAAAADAAAYAAGPHAKPRDDGLGQNFDPRAAAPALWQGCTAVTKDDKVDPPLPGRTERERRPEGRWDVVVRPPATASECESDDDEAKGVADVDVDAMGPGGLAPGDFGEWDFERAYRTFAFESAPQERRADQKVVQRGAVMRGAQLRPAGWDG